MRGRPPPTTRQIHMLEVYERRLPDHPALVQEESIATVVKQCQNGDPTVLSF